MKAGGDRKYAIEFRDAAVMQVIEGGHSMTAVARSLEMSGKLRTATLVCSEITKFQRTGDLGTEVVGIGWRPGAKAPFPHKCKRVTHSVTSLLQRGAMMAAAPEYLWQTKNKGGDWHAFG